MAELGEIPHQNSAIQTGTSLFLKANCNNFGAAHSPEPAGGFMEGLLKILSKDFGSFC